MNNKFEISNDGSIFSIANDGTIHRIAKIDNQGNIEGKNTNSSNKVLWFLLIIAVITAIVLGVNLSSAESDLYQLDTVKNNLNNQISELKQQNENLESEYISQISSLETKFSNISSIYPFKINRIEIANTENDETIINDYGNTLYDNHIRYIQPKIYYTGFISQSVTLYRKIFNPDGTLKYNSSFSTTYTGNGTTATIYTGNNEIALHGWGNPSTSIFSKGTYRIEIWYEGICFGTKSFTIY